ncbi:MAG TPA: mechanosensitive ion channel domain-containing protein [Allosphingosinicella sp.]|jgi:small-conductance mechanosensitive channel
MRTIFDTFGVTWPNYSDWVSAGAALVILVLVWLSAAAVGRWIGPKLSGFWTRHGGARGEELSRQTGPIVRYLAFLVAAGIALNVDAWRPLALIVFGIAIAVGAALLVLTLARGLQLARWMAWLLAGFAFVGLLGRSVGSLRPLTRPFDRIGFSAGKVHITLLTLVQAVIVLLALYAAVKLLNRIAAQSIRHMKELDPTQQLLAQKLAGVAIVIIAFFAGIDLLGIDLTALTVFSGAFGLAVGFGLQKTFGNLIAGIILLMDRSVKPGDVITVGDTFGHVTKIGVRAVSIVTRDGKEHLIPNENLMTKEVENWSYSSRDVRIHIPVGISYDCDLAKAQKLMVEAAKEAKRVLKSPAPSVWLRAFGESTVDHEILLWVGDPEAGLGSVRSEVLNRVWVLFKENGIVLPNPQRDIHIKDWPARLAAPAGKGSDADAGGE